MSDVIRAPAKVNLLLQVVGRRSDGYHLLHMLNACIDLCDEIELEFISGRDIELSVEGDFSQEVRAELANVERNLAARAARHFAHTFALEFGLRMRIRKKIPLGSGLGGGSSDAALVLRYLERSFTHKLESLKALDREQKLASIALALGADVPFFLSTGFAAVSGIGEKIHTLDAKILAGAQCIVIVPKVHIETSRMYALLRERSPSLPLVDTPYCPSLNVWEDVLALLHNDFEDLAKELYPPVADAFRELRKVQEVCFSLSGSGSAIIGIPRDRLDDRALLQVAGMLRASDLPYYLCSFVSASAPSLS